MSGIASEWVAAVAFIRALCLLSPGPAPGCIGAAHPATIVEEVGVFSVEKIIGQVAFSPCTRFSVYVACQIIDNRRAIAQINAWKLFRLDIALAFNYGVCLCSAQYVIDVHYIYPPCFI